MTVPPGVGPGGLLQIEVPTAPGGGSSGGGVGGGGVGGGGVPMDTTGDGRADAVGFDTTGEAAAAISLRATSPSPLPSNSTASTLAQATATWTRATRAPDM